MNCMICNSNVELFSENSYLKLKVYVCKKCDFYICGENIDERNEKVSDLYNKKYWDERNSEISINSNYTDVDSEGKRRNWVSQYAYSKVHISGKKLLEIGVGSGQSIVWFEQEGFEVRGIEPDGRNVDMINQLLTRGNVIQSSVEKFNDERKYDIIWMSHVLEHVVNPIEFLGEIKKKMFDDGIFFIEVPNSCHSTTLNDSINKNPHLFHFSKNSLMKMVEAVGYKVIRCDCFRPATKQEGVKNKVFKNKFPYYPRILTDNSSGRDLRIILKKSTNLE